MIDDNGEVTGRVERRGNLVDIRTDDLQPLQTAKNSQARPCAQTTGFRQPGTGCVPWIQTIQIVRNVDRRFTDHLPDLLDDTLGPEILDSRLWPTRSAAGLQLIRA